MRLVCLIGVDGSVRKDRNAKSQGELIFSLTLL